MKTRYGVGVSAGHATLEICTEYNHWESVEELSRAECFDLAGLLIDAGNRLPNIASASGELTSYGQFLAKKIEEEAKSGSQKTGPAEGPGQGEADDPLADGALGGD